ncbi:MAG TPA: TonB-dependent receptor [Steroidobacteraceae bacterium]|nr:TonB-dependent receptor [Steroidobacteraceae bacterium]
MPRASATSSPALWALAAGLACLPLRSVQAEAPALDSGDSGLSTVVVEATAPAGPSISPTGANDYAVSAEDIAASVKGDTAPVTDLLTQMPGVAIDQNQQIHIRNTEGPQFQYQINGVLIPLDINTNPPFLSMINPMFIKRLDLLDGVLPARYSYATGGVVNIQTKDGCQLQSGEASLMAGQRDTLQPSLQYAGCYGQLSSYVSALYQQSNTAFSSATPGPTPIHDFTKQGQLFSLFAYPLTPTATLSLLLSAAKSSNQLPNVPDLPPAYTLAAVPVPPNSADIDSYLDFTDLLTVLSLAGSFDGAVSYQLAVTQHAITQNFEPDPVGELIYQGVASTASHDDHDYALEGDLSFGRGAHTLGTGFYVGQYRVTANDSSLVFPANAAGAQTSDIPLTVINNDHANNIVAGIYLTDLWRIAEPLTASLGVRWDTLSGFTSDHQVDWSANLLYRPDSLTTLHAGVARYFQVPSFQGISPTAQQAFAGTTAAGPPGMATPLTEDDREWDAGVVRQVTGNLTLSLDAYYEWTTRYLDTGQFGVVPIFAPFNYGTGHIWGSELAARYQHGSFSAYANLTVGRNWQRSVVTGQFNFNPDELAYIDSHAIVLDHQPLYGAAAGANWRLGPYSLAADGLYSSGLRAGFADSVQLPDVVQVNLSGARTFAVPGIGELSNRLAVLNIFDKVNLIRPAQGIGIFQSAYAPRRTLYYTVTLQF